MRRSSSGTRAPGSHGRTDGRSVPNEPLDGAAVALVSGAHRVQFNSIDERVLIDRPGVRGALAQRLAVGLAGSSDVLSGVDPASDDIAFTNDPFAPVLSETSLDAPSVPDFVDQAVAFCNHRLWGTLAAAVIVHPSSPRSAAHTAAAVKRAIAALRYGTIVVNGPPLLGFLYGSTPWGAFPSHEPRDIQSGCGFVHNMYMLTQPEKTVMRTAFRAVPAPPWLVTHGLSREVFRRLSLFYAAPSRARMPAIFWHSLKRRSR